MKKIRILSLMLSVALLIAPMGIKAQETEPETIVKTPIEFNDKAASGGRIRFNEAYNGTYIRPENWKVAERVGYKHVATEYNFVNGGFNMVAKYDPIPILSERKVAKELAGDLEDGNFAKIFNADFAELTYRADKGGLLNGEDLMYYVVKNATNGLITNYNIRFRDLDKANPDLGGFTHPTPVADEGYKFVGWELTGAVTSPDEVIHGNVEAIAKFKKIHTVTFDSKGGSEIQPQSILDGGKIKNLETPTLEGKTFEGWYTVDGKLFDNNTEVTKDITLYAKWSVLASKINQLPELEVKNITIKLGDKLDLKSLIVKASDAEDGNDLKDKVTINDKYLDIKAHGRYQVFYTLKDSQGAEVEAVAIVTVEMKNPPVGPNVPGETSKETSKKTSKSNESKATESKATENKKTTETSRTDSKATSSETKSTKGNVTTSTKGSSMPAKTEKDLSKTGVTIPLAAICAIGSALVTVVGVKRKTKK